MTAIPPAHDKVWRSLITGAISPPLSFLALQLFLGRAKRVIQREPQRFDELCLELRELFVNNQTHPKIINDLDMLLSAKEQP